MKDTKEARVKRALIDKYGTARLQMAVRLIVTNSLSDDHTDIFRHNMREIGGNDFQKEMDEIREDLRCLTHSELKAVVKRFL